MCGIVGYITTDNEKFTQARRGFLKYALMLDTLRGEDSTGVISVDKKFRVKRLRTLAPGFQLANSRQFDKHVPNGWAAIGHNRAATIGKVTVDNAHPFKFGDIHLVHNGTLRKAGLSLPGYCKTVDVDSAQICKSLSEVPPTEAKSVLEQIDGDFAIVWTDERDKSINMARNAARPFHLGFNHDRTLMIFMSDGDHLEILSKGLRNSSAAISSVYSLDTFHHCKWKRGSLKPEVDKFRPFVQPPQTWGQSGTTHKGAHGNMKKWQGGGSNVPAVATPQSRARDAQERAAKRWGTTTETTGTGDAPIITGNRFPINKNVAGLATGMPNRATPAHLEAMNKYFSLLPIHLCRFTPEEFWDIGKAGTIVQATGVIQIQAWGGAEWDATINYVRKDRAEQYEMQDWLVRPIGVTRNRSLAGCPGVLVDLIHWDWEAYKNNIRAKQEDDIRSRTSTGELVIGPDKKLMTKELLLKKLQHGCVDCSGQLFVTCASEYITVNDGVDVLCEQCRWRSELEDQK